jgi:hypothetical protein
MIAEFMTVSGWTFWIVLSLVFLINAFALRDEDNALGAVTFGCLALAGAILLTDAFKGWSWFWLLIVVIGYPVVGVAWAGLKWRAFILRRKAEAKAAYNAAPPTDKPFEEWAANTSAHQRPTAAKEADQIAAWIGLWPWSMIWVGFQYPWRGIVWLAKYVSTSFERWAENLWKD